MVAVAFRPPGQARNGKRERVPPGSSLSRNRLVGYKATAMGDQGNDRRGMVVNGPVGSGRQAAAAATSRLCSDYLLRAAADVTSWAGARWL